MNKIRKEDEVIVIAGRDKGRRGEVLRVMQDGRLLVSGVRSILWSILQFTVVGMFADGTFDRGDRREFLLGFLEVSSQLSVLGLYCCDALCDRLFLGGGCACVLGTQSPCLCAEHDLLLDGLQVNGGERGL